MIATCAATKIPIQRLWIFKNEKENEKESKIQEFFPRAFVKPTESAQVTVVVVLELLGSEVDLIEEELTGDGSEEVMVRWGVGCVHLPI